MLKCPDCQQPIGGDDLNTATDVALCRTCGKQHQYSELSELEPAPGFRIEQLPAGLTLPDDGRGKTLRYRLASSLAWFFLIFALLWDAAVAAFVVRLASRPDSETTLFLCLLAPVGLIVTFIALRLLLGHGELRCRDGELELFTGIGAVGRTRRVRFGDITRIAIMESNIRTNNGPLYGVGIQLSGGKTLWLLRGAKPERQEYAVNFLRTLTARARR